MGSDNRPVRATRNLCVVAIVLVCLSAAGSIARQLAGLPPALLPTDDPLWLRLPTRIFSVDTEWNLPTCFSVLLHLWGAALSFSIASATRRRGEPDVLYWGSLSVLFLGTAADEALCFHEHLITPVERLLGQSGPMAGPFHFAWVLPGLVLLLVLAVLYWRFLRRQGRTGRLMMLAAAIFAAGAVGMEMLAGWYLGDHERDALYDAIATLEESLEMAGMILLIHALQKHLAAMPALRPRQSRTPERAAAGAE